MQKIATASEMQAIDRNAIDEFGIPGTILMENAGRGIVFCLEELFPDIEGKKITVISGKGNNGGDGFVIARHLFNRNADVQVFLLGKLDSLKEDARLNADIAFKMGVAIKEFEEKNLSSMDRILRHSDVIVDAIFGTGLTKPARGMFEKVIDKINQQGKFIVAVDIPSGIDSDTGNLMGPHVRADLTLALAMMKRSHLLYPPAEAMGQVRIVDIGIPEKAVEKENIRVQMPEEEDIRAYFPTRNPDTHKGTYGHVLIVAGSTGKSGAAGLTALAALRSGCGLVTLALPESCQKAFELHPLEVMTVPLPETNNGCMEPRAKELILEHCRGKSAVGIGPGISTSPQTEELLLNLLPSIQCPIVLDADGLNCLENHVDIFTQLQTETILTPHPKEMSRLSSKPTSDIQQNRIDFASEFARAKNTCLVLKGARTLIALPDGTVYINPTGNPGMATGGSGDVLTGIITGCIAQGLTVSQAGIAGTYIHGVVGDTVAKETSETSLIAGDLLNSLPENLKRILS